MDEVTMFPTDISFSLLAFCRVAMGFVFVASSLSKVRDVAQFQQTIRQFHILPSSISREAAVFFLGGEFAVVILMIIGGRLLLPGFALAIFLLLLFCFALVSVRARKLQISCNCFGVSVKPISQIDILRNSGLLLCACTGVIMLGLAKDAQRDLNFVEWVLISVSAGVFVIVWLQLGEIVQLFRHN
jgi:uncharacterized membrane protein YphA (DoxX/SURF4 family)